MYPIIAHIHGPFAINGYGTAILIGVLIFLYLTYYNKKRSILLSNEQLNTFFIINLIGAIVGGRLLYIFADWHTFSNSLEFLELWDGGFSILGTLLGIIITSILYLKINHIPVLPVCDLMSLNAAIMQACGRFGCFLAGCCYGFASQKWYSVIFTNPQGLAPLCIPLMPTQLISALFFLCIFFLMHVLKPWCIKEGQLTALYLVFTSAERFFNDFLRGERVIVHTNYFPFNHFSLHQYIALVIIVSSLIWFLFLTFMRKKS
jgi:phosphatidylglycerol---prolipoprotein diacylglyceryl transferase